MQPAKLLYRVSPEWAVLNFLRIFEAQISDYRHQKYNDKKQTARIIERALMFNLPGSQVQRYSTGVPTGLDSRRAPQQHQTTALQKVSPFKRTSTMAGIGEGTGPKTAPQSIHETDEADSASSYEPDPSDDAT